MRGLAAGLRYPPLLLAIGLTLFLAVPLPALAGHDIGQSCYVCHHIKSGSVWPGSFSIWTGKKIGMNPYGRPITCDVCHTDYGARFRATSASHHPVAVIQGDNTLAIDDYGKTITCKDCHDADSYDPSPANPNLVPDLAPAHYANPSGNTTGDGYPNHDVSSPDNQVSPGDPPHLAGSTPAATSYDPVPAPRAEVAAKYALCFACHGDTATTATARGVNVRRLYLDGGHYFKAANPSQGIANPGDRIPCIDCHASHNSANSSRLISPRFSDGSLWTAVVYGNRFNPSADNVRAMCTGCHDDATTVPNGRPLVRGREPSVAPPTVSDHLTYTGTRTGAACTACHDPHRTPAGGNDCLNCHRTGGPVSARHQMTDLEFPADGTWNGGAGEDNASIQVSGHGRAVYAPPYDTKAVNECRKCHGSSHPTNAAKLQDADNTANVYPTGFAYGLSYDGANWSANPASFADANDDGVIDGNGLCLSCHDGVDALSPADNANIRIGGVNPPKVYSPQGGASSGHDRESGASYPVSGNPAGQQLCTSCHKYHASDNRKLLPGSAGPFGAGNGYTWTMPTWAGVASVWQAPRPNTAGAGGYPSNAGRMVIGNRAANAIAYADRSDPASGKGFGTAGSAKNVFDGLCDACHRDPATVRSTRNGAHTHEGDNTSYGSRNLFAKDCLECHNPHGGGNAYMVRDLIYVPQTATSFAVTFQDNTQHDPAGTGDALCNVCHDPNPFGPNGIRVGHNYRGWPDGTGHAQGRDCTGCHAHGDTADPARFGFPQGSCTSCHGPDNDPDRAGMPAPGDGGTYHVDASNVIGVRGGDNTAHKIHVDYLKTRRGLSAANACHVCHRGGGSGESHPGNADNTSFKAGPRPSGDNVQVAMDNTGAVLNVSFGPGKPQPAYAGTPGMAAGAANGWKTCGSTACHYSMSPSWSGRTQTGGLAVDSPAVWPPAGTVAPGTANRVIDKIRLSADSAGFVSVSTLKVRLAAAATAQDNVDIAAVKFHEDADNDNVIDTPSLPMGGGKAVYSPGTRSYTRSGIHLTLPPGGTTHVLVVADIASTASGNRTIVTESPDNTYVSSDARSLAFTPFTSETAAVTAPANLTVGSPIPLPTGGYVAQNSGNNVIDRIRLAADASGAVSVTMMKVRLFAEATADNSDISVKLFEDANLDGAIDNVSAPLGGGPAVYSAGDRGFTRSGMSLSLAAGQTRDVLVAVDVAAGATVGRTVTVEAFNTTFVESNAASTAFNAFQSSTFTVQTPPGTVAVTQGNTNPAAIAGYHVQKGVAANVVSERIRLTAAGGPAVVDNVWVKNVGNSLDNTDVEFVRFYDNPDLALALVNGTFNGDEVLLGQGTYNGADNTYRLPGINYTINAGQTREIVVVFTPDNVLAEGQRTFRTQVNGGYVTGSYIASQPPVTPFSGPMHTIGPALWNGKFHSNLTGWPLTVTTTPTGGTYSSAWVSDNTATADGSGSGYSVLANNATATARTYAGYHEYTLSTPIPVSTSISGQIRYRRTRAGTTVTTGTYLYVDVVYSDSTSSTWTAVNNSSAGDTVWNTYPFSLFTGKVIAKVRIRYQLVTPAAASASLGVRWDEIYISYSSPYGSSPNYAPPRSTGDATAFRCDACHQFGPRDNPLDGNGHPATGLYRDQYYYSSPGAHIRHGVGDPQEWPSDAPAAGNGGPCAPCHGDVSGYDTVNHVDGVKSVNSGSIGKGAGANGTWDPGTRTCASVNCHGNQATPAWGTGSTSCADCHAGSGDVDDFAPDFQGNWPVQARIDNAEWLYSGHGKASGTYDASGNPAAAFGGSNPCAYCHDGSVPHGDAANPFRLKDQSASVASTPSWNATCLVCHRKTGNPGGYDPGPEGGGPKNASASSRVDTAHYGSHHAGTDKGGRFCHDCHDAHGDRTASGGNVCMIHDNVAKATDNTTGYGRPTAFVSAVFTDNLGGTSYAKSSAPYDGICQVCHTTVRHYTAASGDGHNAGTRCTVCHTHNVGFDAKCVDCHDNDGARVVPAPMVVWSKGVRPNTPSGVTQGWFGSHLVARKTDAFGGATDWNAQCEKCHTGHGGPGINLQVPMPPASWIDPSGRLTGTNMQTRLGFDNGAGSWSHAVDNGVWLGGSLTSGTTEAEICWNCHDHSANAVSEWGYNTRTTPAGYPVVWEKFPTQHDGTSRRMNYGHIYTDNTYATRTSDWTAGYWQNEYDPLLKVRIASVHSGSFDPSGQVSSVGSNVDGSGVINHASPALEGKQYIRCSYCHDVHDLGAAKGPPADAPDKGKPFLRGKWVGNPYPPELPPRTAYYTSGGYTTTPNLFGPGRPRGVSTARDRGGYFIDQNSGWPTDDPAMNSYDNVAGLCQLCHGTNVDTMKFYTGSNLWRTGMVNGHSNSTIGGTRGNARDIFTASRYGYGMGMQANVPYTPYVCGSTGGNCDGNYPQARDCCDCYSDCFNLVNSGWFAGKNNTVAGTGTQGSGDYSNWYGTGTIGGMNGAGSMAHRFTCSKCHSPHATGLPALLTHSCLDTGTSEAAPFAPANLIANNCHRKTTTTDGWNRLAPGAEK